MDQKFKPIFTYSTAILGFLLIGLIFTMIFIEDLPNYFQIMLYLIAGITMILGYFTTSKFD